jgi:7-cyano-7-deazaguanine synthase
VKSAVLLLSGGLDSSVLLAKLVLEGVDTSALSILYGQKHKREIEASQKLAEYYGVPHRVLEVPQLASLFEGNALTSDKIPVPDGHYAEESMKQTVVPNRNMLFLALAGAWALSLKKEAVAYAAHSGDHSIYPDCRPEFIESMAQSFQLCDWEKLELFTPFSKISKTEIVTLGRSMNVPFEMTWSCYKGRDFHCAKCGTCVERQEAFLRAGVIDPTLYDSDGIHLAAGERN